MAGSVKPARLNRLLAHGQGRTGTLACCLIERLGGAEAAQEVHGMLNGTVPVPGRKEDSRELEDNGEADEGGSVSLPPAGSQVSEEPVLATTEAGQKPSSQPAEIKQKKRRSVAKQPALPPAHPASTTLDFHTSRRMTHPNLRKPGVSIPSQRRFLRYFVDSLKSTRSERAELYPGGEQPKPMLRLKEVVLVNVHPAKDTLTPKVRGEAARYDDALVGDLEGRVAAAIQASGDGTAPRKAILEGAGGLGIGMSGVGTDAIGHEDEKASIGGAGMIRSLGPLREDYTETGEMAWDDFGERSTDLVRVAGSARTPARSRRLTGPGFLHANRPCARIISSQSTSSSSTPTGAPPSVLEAMRSLTDYLLPCRGPSSASSRSRSSSAQRHSRASRASRRASSHAASAAAS
jgi:hypothetical protein